MRESVDFQPRMTMSQVNVADDKDRQVRLWLLSASPMDGATHYRLAGRFTANGQTWEVNRRYSQFLALRDKLVKFLTSSPDTCPGCENYLHALTLFAFPKKHFFASRTPLVVNYRVKALRSFVNLLAAWTFSNSPKCPTCGGYAFDIVRNFFVDDAHALSGSDMDYIRDSMSLGTFTGGGERGSAFTRRHSWIPAAAQTALMQGGGGSQRGSQSTQWGTQSMRGTQSTRGSQAQARPSMQLRQTMANMPPPRGAGRARGRPDQRTNAINDAAYEAFDDYLPERPAHSKPSHKNTEAAADTTKFKTLTQAEAQAQAEAERRRAENEQAAASRSSTRGSSRSSSGQFRSTADPLQRQTSGASSSDASMRRSELQQQQQLQYQQLQQHQQHQQQHQQHQQHHQVRMQSPPPKPRRQATPLFDSFVSDHSTTPSMAAEPVFVHGDELRRLGMASSDDEGKLDYSEDEIDVTGLALASPRRPRPKASSGEGLWQPWELAKVA